ncbi:hypothetical protein ABQD49_06005 [Lactococcus petauri]|uniref:hypothetical protein n=1 Tax=Lactococcus petauri TaxID=1940789 RepID=UPI0032E45EF6
MANSIKDWILEDEKVLEEKKFLSHNSKNLGLFAQSGLKKCKAFKKKLHVNNVTEKQV